MLALQGEIQQMFFGKKRYDTAEAAEEAHQRERVFWTEAIEASGGSMSAESPATDRPLSSADLEAYVAAEYENDLRRN